MRVTHSKLREAERRRTTAASMSFFGRVMHYVFNEVLVNTLANR